MFDSVLVANRGEIARRIIRTSRRMGLHSVAVYSEADADLPYVAEADEAVLLGPAAPAQSYLNIEAMVAAARRGGVAAVHPGYGFLSEKAEFATAVLDAGLGWVGPPPEAITAMGDKINARNRVGAAGVPVSDGTAEPISDAGEAAERAAQLGYPLMVKAAAGGGGIGMAVARDEAQLRTAFETVRSRAMRYFASPAVLLERYVENARHVEIQVLGLADGTVLTLGDRDCSVQRRHQKVAEETPSPGVGAELRHRMEESAVRVAKSVGYRNAGTVEFLVDLIGQDYVFLEMNTRLQVEHPITELVTGIDLVEEQFRVAAGDPPSEVLTTARPRGHALELRVYAEDPRRFLPSPGTITEWLEPSGPGIRVDSGYREGNVVTPFYDPLLAKLCVSGADRGEVLDRARTAVKSWVVDGVRTNLPFLADLLNDERFVSGDYDTQLISEMRP